MKYLKSIRKDLSFVKSFKIMHGPYDLEFLNKYFTDTCNIYLNTVVQNIYSHCGGGGSYICKSCAFRNDQTGYCSLTNRAEMDIIYRSSSVSYSSKMDEFIEGLNYLRHMSVTHV